jgi:hypothetical protein
MTGAHDRPAVQVFKKLVGNSKLNLNPPLDPLSHRSTRPTHNTNSWFSVNFNLTYSSPARPLFVVCPTQNYPYIIIVPQKKRFLSAEKPPMGNPTPRALHPIRRAHFRSAASTLTAQKRTSYAVYASCTRARPEMCVCPPTLPCHHRSP